MAAQYPQNWRPLTRVALTTGHANSRDGSGAVAGGVGLANGRTIISSATLIAQGNNVQNVIRVFFFDGTNWIYQYEIPFLARTVSAYFPALAVPLPMGYPLASATQKMGYDLESNDTLYVVERIVDS